MIAILAENELYEFNRDAAFAAFAERFPASDGDAETLREFGPFASPVSRGVGRELPFSYRGGAWRASPAMPDHVISLALFDLLDGYVPNLNQRSRLSTTSFQRPRRSWLSPRTPSPRSKHDSELRERADQTLAKFQPAVESYEWDRHNKRRRRRR